ncbi:MAG: hypothetical protein KGL92_02580 [Gammaproteobacteria bacterium]|nr:hypothetical protein [Gammaproteobacteria bacterium]
MPLFRQALAHASATTGGADDAVVTKRNHASAHPDSMLRYGDDPDQVCDRGCRRRRPLRPLPSPP